MIKPLAKPKFWAQSIVALGEMLSELGQPVPEVCQRSIPSLTSMTWEEHARTMYRLGDRFHVLSYSLREWGKWGQLQNYCKAERPEIGKIVYIQDAVMGNRQIHGIGQLIGLTHDPLRNRVYDERDKGPPPLYPVYVLKLFDGTEMRWTNARYQSIPTFRTIEMFRQTLRLYG